MIGIEPDRPSALASNPSTSGLVSIVTIFRDAAAFLGEAIESVVAQDYRHWELLLVDDGSTDEGSVIAREYAGARPQQIRYLEHSGRANLGMSASRRVGIDHARGEYIAFIDADDVWMPEKLGWQVHLLRTVPDAAMTYGPGLYWYEWAGATDSAARDFVQPLDVTTATLIPPPHLIPRWLGTPYSTPGTSGSLVRAEALTQSGGPIAQFAGMYEDQVLFCKLALRYPILVSHRCLYKYRQHDSSCCSEARRSGARRDARLAFLRWLSAHVAEHHLGNEDVTIAVDRELRTLRDINPFSAGARGVARRMVPLSIRQWIRRHGIACSE
jgi:glycosyltransferase involved in cell wall biosynthesis